MVIVTQERKKKKHIETGEQVSMCWWFFDGKTGIILFSEFCFQRVVFVAAVVVVLAWDILCNYLIAKLM